MLALFVGALVALPGHVRVTLESAPPLAGARLEVLSYAESLPPGCNATSSSAALAPGREGRVLLRLTGESCVGTASVVLRWSAVVPVATRAISLGEPLEGAVVFLSQDITAVRAPLSRLGPGALAARSLRAGAVIASTDVRMPGPLPGEPLQVVVTSGPIAVRETGRVVPCEPGRTCALVRGGKRVSGLLVGGQLVVELP